LNMTNDSPVLASTVQVPTEVYGAKKEDGLTPRRLMWLRFRKHKLAVAGLIVTLMIYLVAIFADFLSPADPNNAAARYALHPPHAIQFFDSSDGKFRLHVNGFKLERDPETLKPKYVTDSGRKIDLQFFAPAAEPYLIWGFIPSSVRFFGTSDPSQPVFLAGADRLGRDLLSRTIHGAQISMSIGLVGVALSLFLGIIIGGLSGYYGGRIDWVLQRVTEFVIALPTIPIWMALAAALPKDWPSLWIYFMITVIVSLIGWTDLARVVRGKFLSLRNEDFVIAARIDGCSELRIVLRQMLPSFMSHVIATVTLAIPLMILAETSLSFLGLGLQPPAISWGVLLKEVQNVRSIASAPWLFIPGVAVVIAVLSLNFFGDGLRDAADPYS
jgi:peptide/nickel transport system permease protein